MTDEAIKFPGQVIVDEISITTSNGFVQNITNQVAGVQIFEDMFSPFITGNLVILDALDIKGLFPFVGEEFVTLKIRTPSFTGSNRVINSKFYIYKHTDEAQVNNATKAYRLHFISIEAIVDLNKKMSIGFEGAPSSIVESILTKPFGLQTDKNINVEPTPNGIKFVSNFWNPIKAIKYVCERSINAAGSPSYLFFENRNGLNFISLDTLYKAPVMHSFFSDNLKRAFREDGSNWSNVEEQYKNILQINIPEGFDYMNMISSGAFASKQISFDTVSKKYNVRNYDMISAFPKEYHMNPYSIASDSSIRRASSMIEYVPKMFGNFNNFGDVSSSKYSLQRNSIIKRLDNNRLEVTVYGRTDYTVGQKVNVTLYKDQPIYSTESNDDILDRLNSGNYIITAINHIISRANHECVMELCKDSMILDLNKGK